MGSIGSKIREVRKEKGWTQQQLATRAGCHAPLISVWETGSTTPELSSVVKLAGALERSISYFIDGNYDSDLDCLKDPKNTCLHPNRVFAVHVLTSYPPRKPWACPDCLQSGAVSESPQTEMLSESYEDIMKRIKEAQNG